MKFLSKILKGAKSAQGVIQLVGIVVSATIAALTAMQSGGDPTYGAVTGVTVNTLLSTFAKG